MYACLHVCLYMCIRALVFAANKLLWLNQQIAYHTECERNKKKKKKETRFKLLSQILIVIVTCVAENAIAFIVHA